MVGCKCMYVPYAGSVHCRVYVCDPCVGPAHGSVYLCVYVCVCVYLRSMCRVSRC